MTVRLGSSSQFYNKESEMFKATKLMVVAACIVLASACGTAKRQKLATVDIKTKTDVEQQSYSMGVSMGSSLKSDLDKNADIGIILQPDIVILGIKDALAGEIQLSDAKLEDLMLKLKAEVRECYAEKQKKMASEAIKEGQAFLAKNAKKDGVITTESGLQYSVIVAGEGEKPTAEDIVKIHYRGTLINGTEFDSSLKRNQPVRFPLNRVFPGWTEGVQLMSKGAKYKFFIPAELAYGKQGAGKNIPPNSTLIFEVELLDFTK